MLFSACYFFLSSILSGLSLARSLLPFDIHCSPWKGNTLFAVSTRRVRRCLSLSVCVCVTHVQLLFVCVCLTCDECGRITMNQKQIWSTTFNVIDSQLKPFYMRQTSRKHAISSPVHWVRIGESSYFAAGWRRFQHSKLIMTRAMSRCLLNYHLKPSAQRLLLLSLRWWATTKNSVRLLDRMHVKNARNRLPFDHQNAFAFGRFGWHSFGREICAVHRPNSTMNDDEILSLSLVGEHFVLIQTGLIRGPVCRWCHRRSRRGSTDLPVNRI